MKNLASVRTILIILSLVAIVSSELYIDLIGADEVTISMVDNGAEESGEKESNDKEESESEKEHKPFDSAHLYSQIENSNAATLWFRDGISIQYLEIHSPPPEAQDFA